MAGPLIGGILFGANFTLSGPGLAALTAGCCLMVVGLTLAQALIALRRYAITAFAWVVGVVVFLVIIALPASDVFVRSEIGFVIAAAVSAAWMAVVALRATSVETLAEHAA